MATQDQLEIIAPSGDVQFYGLDPAKGITNIGRHPDNDIVIESPDVAPFHAVLVHQRKPYQFTLLAPSGKTRIAGQPGTPNAPYTLHAWDTIELDGCSIVYMEDAPGGAPAQPVIVRPGEPGPVSPVGIVRPPAPAPPAPTAAPPAPPTVIAPVAPGPTGAAGAGVPTVAPPAPAAPVPPGPAAPPPSPGGTAQMAAMVPAGPLLAAPVADQTDENILVEVSRREFVVDVEQPASFDVTVINGGSIVATMLVSLEGLPDGWIEISPNSVNLFEGERATLHVTITPPRLPSTRAGTHYFGLLVTSPNYPGRRNRTGMTLGVNPFYEYTVNELSPRQQRISWGRRQGRASFSLANLGNSPVTYRLDARDDENGCQFEFQLGQGAAGLVKQAEVRLAPEESQSVGLTIMPLRRRFFGFAGHTYSYTVGVTPLDGAQMPRTVLAQAVGTPLIGPWHVIALLLLLAILIALLFRPKVQAFSADLPEVMSSEIMAGRKVTLSYQTSWFAHSTIDQDVGKVEGSQGTVQVAPTKTTTYRLTTTDFLTFLYPPWFTATQELTVVVDPILPIVRFSADRDQMIVGETITLSWEVLNADVVVLKTNGAPETLPAEQYTGSRQVSPVGETTYTLEARNAYTTGEGVARTVVVNATKPTETPLPQPVIQRFDALPNPITAGDEVTLEWAVTGVESVQIDPLGSFPPTGKTVVKPDQTTAYQLIASNGQAAPVRSLREVVVNPAPTETPVPGSPVIQLFTANVTDVFLGSSDADNVQLAWSVTGDVSGIQLSGQTLGTISGLERQGSRVVSVNDAAGDHVFTLTADNGPERKASQTVTIAVNIPTPAISGLSPSSAFVGDAGFTLTVTGANFLPGATVRWNGVDRPTTYISAFQVSASIPSSDISETGSFMVTVVNPATAGSQESSAATFKVNNPTPILTAVTPITATVGDADTTIVVTGSGFIAKSEVHFNNTPIATTYTSSTQLTAVVPEASLATAGTFIINVFNPEPVGGTSGAITFTVENPVPTITSLGPPSYVIVGGKNGSEVSWDGDLRQAIFVSDTQLQLTVPSDDLTQVKTVQVAVINPPPVQSGGVSNSVPFEISKNGTSVSVSASPVLGVTGQPITFTAYVTPDPGGINCCLTGSVIFKVGDTIVATQPISGTSASFTQSFAAGDVTISAEYDGTADQNFASSSFTSYNYTVNQAGVLITISSNTPTSYGTSAQFTVNVTAADPGTNNPVGPAGGTVTLSYEGGSLGGPTTLSSGSASFTVSGTAMPVGTHSVTASYDGTNDPNFNSGTSLPYSHTVTKIVPTVTVSTSGNVAYGRTVTLTATLTSVAGAPGDGAPITFSAGTTVLGTGYLSSGSASYTTYGTQLNAGSYTITAAFAGDTNFLGANGTTGLAIAEAPVAVTMNATNPSTTDYGTPVTLTASLDGGPAGAPDTGTVTFRYGSTILATVNQTFGSASFTTSPGQLNAGSYSFTAQYNGESSNYAASAISSSVSHTVNKLTPTIVLINSFTGTSAPFKLDSGPMTWTATVTGPGGGIPGPTGTVGFTYYSNYSTDHCYGNEGGSNHYYWDHYWGTTNGSLSASGTVSYSHTLLYNEGADLMQARYNGDTNYNAVSAPDMLSDNYAGVTCTKYP